MPIYLSLILYLVGFGYGMCVIKKSKCWIWDFGFGQDGSCRIGLGSSGNGETVTAPSSEVEVIVPRKSDKIKIMGGALRGATGKLIGVDGTDGIVKVDDTLDVKILDLVILAKLAQP